VVLDIGEGRTLWYLLVQVELYGIYWSRQNIVVFIGAGRTLWYLLEQVEHYGIYWSR
jgi:hypothetical protein